MVTAVRRPRVIAALAVAALAVGAITVPVLGQGGASPGAGAQPAPEATAKPGKGPKVEHPGRGNRADKPAEAPVTLRGRVGTAVDAEGQTRYTLTVDGEVLDLDAGPPWWWGEEHPLAPYVDTTVTIEGDRAAGSDHVDVRTVDGTLIREPGRPPWAGGWKAVGPKHPGWTEWKADRDAAKEQGHGNGRPPWAGPKSPDADAEGE